MPIIDPTIRITNTEKTAIIMTTNKLLSFFVWPAFSVAVESIINSVFASLTVESSVGAIDCVCASVVMGVVVMGAVVVRGGTSQLNKYLVNSHLH